MMNVTRVSASLKILPPYVVGMKVYQIMYAPMIQKYTSGWPKYQKSMRVSSTLMPGVQPSDHGISRQHLGDHAERCDDPHDTSSSPP